MRHLARTLRAKYTYLSPLFFRAIRFRSFVKFVAQLSRIVHQLNLDMKIIEIYESCKGHLLVFLITRIQNLFKKYNKY